MGGLPPRIRVLGQAGANEPVESGRGRRLQRGHRLRLARQDGRGERGLRALREGLLANRHLVEHRSQGEDVGAGVGRPALDLLRRHVRQRAEQCPFPRQVGRGLRGLELAPAGSADERGDHLGQAEVEELHARPRQHHVAGLQVAVNDPLAVRRVQGTGDLDAAAQRLVERQGTSSETILERFTLEQLHHQEVVLALATDVEERADVRVREPGDRPRLLLESLAGFGRRGPMQGQDLDRDGPIEAGVARLVDLAHSARPERREDLVRPEARTGEEAHGLAAMGHSIGLSARGQTPHPRAAESTDSRADSCASARAVRGAHGGGRGHGSGVASAP